MDRLPIDALQGDNAIPVEAAGLATRQGSQSKVAKIATSTAPWLIIAGLLWAGLFIKPQPVGSTVSPPVIERRDFFYGMAIPAPRVFWIAGSNGKIARSEDGGVTWKRQEIKTTAHLQDIAAWDSKHAVTVGNGGIVAITADGGATWSLSDAPKSQVANKLTRVLPLADGHAWAVGEMGALLQSTDFGKTWQRKRDEEDVGWNDIAFADAANGCVVGEFGRILRTADGGNTWTAIQTPVKSSLMGVAFRDARNGVAVGLEGVVLTTSDGGINWQQVKSGATEHLFTVAWDAKKNAWIAGGNQGVWVRGMEGGATWATGRLDARDLSWHTKAVVADGKVYFAGANVGAWDGSAWKIVTSSGRTPVAEETLPDLGGRSRNAPTSAH